MKLIYGLFFLITLCFVHLNAQEQGNILLSGSFKYKVSDGLPEELSFFGALVEGYKNTQFTVLPRAGFFINSNTAVGFGFGYSQNKTEITSDSEKETFTSPRLFIEPFIRHYKTIGDKACFFIDAAVLYQSGTDKMEYKDTDFPEDNITNEIENSGFGISISPGFTYKITKQIAFEISVGKLSYSKTESKPKGAPSSVAVKNTSYGLDLDLKHVMLGVELYLSK